MRLQTFYDWLTREVVTSRMALARLYETRDRLLYVEAPPLRQRYLALFGEAEEPVLRAELEVTLLRGKLERVRAAVNRREKIDLEKIEAEVENERQELVSEAESADLTLGDLPELTEQETQTLQKQYHEITSSFHPAMNSDLTETQKELFEKAVEAYKVQDKEQMALVYEMLFSPEEQTVTLEADNREITSEERRLGYSRLAAELTTDYSLAKTLYDCFAPLEEDRVVRSTYLEYEEQRKQVQEEISMIRNSFPFSAVETMNSSEKTADYLAELRLRLRRAQEEQEELEKQISELTEVRPGGE